MSQRAPHQTVHVRDADLAYVSAGDGDAMVFVHGSVSDYRSWRNQLPFFATSYRALSYSRRYHWPNSPPDAGIVYSLDRHVADLGAVIAELGLAPVRLVGSSYGAMTALAFAVVRPSLVHSLVLGEPPLIPWLATLPEDAGLVEEFMTNAFEPAGAAFASGDAEAGVRTFINGVIGNGAFDRLPLPARETMLDNAAEMRAETATPSEQYFAPLLPDDVRGLKIPVLLVEGAFSPRMFGLITDELANSLPIVQRVVVPDASHGMHSQNPDVYNEAVMTFQSEC